MATWHRRTICLRLKHLRVKPPDEHDRKVSPAVWTRLSSFSSTARATFLRDVFRMYNSAERRWEKEAGTQKQKLHPTVILSDQNKDVEEKAKDTGENSAEGKKKKILIAMFDYKGRNKDVTWEMKTLIFSYLWWLDGLICCWWYWTGIRRTLLVFSFSFSLLLSLLVFFSPGPLVNPWKKGEDINKANHQGNTKHWNNKLEWIWSSCAAAQKKKAWIYNYY